jgi:hypothetical protein
VPNQTEERFARDVLEPLQAGGGLVRHEFEATTWHVHRFAKYTPDWTCTMPDLSLWFVEIKGGVIHEASRLRYRGHSMARPWHRWTMVQWERKAKLWRVVHDSQGKGL